VPCPRLRIVTLGLVALAASLAGAQERVQVSLVNGTAEADYVQISANGAAELRGNVVLHAERLGPDNAVADLKADKLTAIVGSDKDGKPTITKVFASGRVHVEATTRDERKGETRTMICDCDRVTYLASEEVIHLLTETARPIVAHVTVDVVPTAGNKAKQPETYRLQLTARKTLDYKLTETPVEELEAEKQG